MTGMTGYSDSWQQLIDMADSGVPAPHGGRLKHNGGPWTRAAGAAEALRTDMGQVKGDFGAAHEGLASGTAGLRAGAVLRTVRTSWERRIETAARECGSLAGKLRSVAKDQGEVEAAIRSSFRSSFPGSSAGPSAGSSAGTGVGPGAGSGVGAGGGR
ncbi:hypothetical protein ACFVWX_15160 [Streptomyces sp. NPDC058220]|uniref:hypothetical protein n=1 Tax=Streptomyces sp. NPDC058220 TaxID=3346387 RepID=UPI0036E54C1E